MNSLQINYFIVLADTLSFTKTAQKLYVSQPAVSKQIAALEKELGYLLVHRTPTGIVLTPAGQLFYDYFSNAITAFKETMLQAAQLNQTDQEPLKIGYQEGWNLAHMIPVINSFKLNTSSGRATQFISCPINDIEQLLVNGEIDIALAISNSFLGNKRLYGIEIASIVNLLFFSKDHPLTNKTNLSLVDFKNDTFFIFEGESIDTEKLIIDFCAPYGFKPKVQTVPNIESMILEVETGGGVAIFDEWIRFKHYPTLSYVEIGGRHSISAFKLKSNTRPELEKFIDLLIKHFSSFHLKEFQ